MRLMGKIILVKQILTEQVSKGGIHMAGDQQPLPYGEVIKLGDKVPEAISVGDILLFTAISAIPLGLKENHVLIEFEDVLAILDKEDIEDART